MLTIKKTYRVFPIVFLIITATASLIITRVSSFSFAPVILSGKNSNNYVSPSSTSTTSTANKKIIALSASSSSSSSVTSSMATLNEETTWNFRMALSNLPTEKGKKTDGIFAIQAKFIEETGYEPPQGIIQQIIEVSSSEEEVAVVLETTTTTEDGAETSLPTTTQMTIKSGRWTLSEDPNDRKDSLWIWGLFKEPLYPFLLLNFEIDRISLPNNSNNPGEEDSIKPFQLYAQINHKRGDNGEVILSLVSDINIREKETFKADPFGAANVEIYEDTSVGQLQLQAIL